MSTINDLQEVAKSTPNEMKKFVAITVDLVAGLAESVYLMRRELDEMKRNAAESKKQQQTGPSIG